MSFQGQKSILLNDAPYEISRGALTRYWQKSTEEPTQRGFFGACAYYFSQTFSNLLSMPIGSSIFVFTVTVLFFFLGSFLLCLQNLSSVLSRGGESNSLIAYIKTDVSESDMNLLLSGLDSDPNITKVDYISREEALELFKEDLGEGHSFLKALDEDNPLPASVEIFFEKDETGLNSTEDRINAMANRVEVDEVIRGGSWSNRLSGLIKFIKMVGIIGLGITFLIVGFLANNSIRLLMNKAKDEREILNLLGASKSYVNIPFVLGGALQGFFGTVLGLGILAFLYYQFVEGYSFSKELPFLNLQLEFLEVSTLFLLLILGTLIAAMGSYIATSQYGDRHLI